MSNYRKYVELNELVYEKEVVGYRVSFYVIIPNGVTSWIHKECDDDFTDFKKDAGKKLKSILKDFNKGLHGFKVDDGVLSEKAWLYFGIIKK